MRQVLIFRRFLKKRDAGGLSKGQERAGHLLIEKLISRCLGQCQPSKGREAFIDNRDESMLERGRNGAQALHHLNALRIFMPILLQELKIEMGSCGYPGHSDEADLFSLLDALPYLDEVAL
jgi:hypothetical protein